LSPFVVFIVPQTPAVHVGVEQPVADAGQSFACKHWTQVPAPSQWSALSVPQPTPGARYSTPQQPFVHVATLQSPIGAMHVDLSVHVVVHASEPPLPLLLPLVVLVLALLLLSEKSNPPRMLVHELAPSPRPNSAAAAASTLLIAKLLSCAPATPDRRHCRTPCHV
jgi:hypothetical protein